jgi:hypothetical protein
MCGPHKTSLTLPLFLKHFNHVRKVSSHVYIRDIDLVFVSQIFLLGFGTVPTVCYICFSHYYISVQPRRCRSTGYIVYLFLFLFILNLCFPHGELGLLYISWLWVFYLYLLFVNKKRNVANFYWKYVYWHFLFIGKMLHRFSCNHAGYLFSRITTAQ